MLRLLVIPLLLCACAARPSDDPVPIDESTGDETTDDETTSGQTTVPPATTGDSLDDSSGPASSSTTVGDTGDTGDTTGDAAFTFADIQPILDEHCVIACHSPGGEWGFLLDMSGSAYDAIVGVPAPQFSSMSLVEPGDPEASYLWHKLNGTQAAVGGSGIAMPKARIGMMPTVLTPEQFTTIEQWILAGAEP